MIEMDLRQSGFDYIRGNRRREARYRFAFEMSYRCTGGGANRARRGTGTTIDFSSHGLSFASDTPLRMGTKLAVTVNWDTAFSGPVQLKAVGTVVRSEGRRTAVRISNWNFAEHQTSNRGSARKPIASAAAC